MHVINVVFDEKNENDLSFKMPVRLIHCIWKWFIDIGYYNITRV
jgi:hypothetical protein